MPIVLVPRARINFFALPASHLVAFVALLCAALFLPAATGLGLGLGSQVALAQDNGLETTPITTPTDERVLSLLDTGNNMLVENRSQQAYSHFQTFALQFPGNGPLMQAWALAARAADRQQDLADEILGWDGRQGRPSPEMAAFVRSYLFLFDVDTNQDAEAVDAELQVVEADILEAGLNVDASSNLQLVLSMIALRDTSDPAGSLTRAQSWLEGAQALDPLDPTVAQMVSVVGYLVRAQELVALRRPLSVSEVAEAGLEVGAVQSGRLPGAIRQRSAALMQALVLQQDRDADMPREYLRGLTNVVALRDLGPEGAETAATTWVSASALPAFRQEQSFQEYGSFLGRYMSCYADPVDGLNLLSRLEGIRFDQSRNLSTPQGRLAAERRLETLVLLWRFAARMRLTDEARAYRDDARALSEQLANRDRQTLVHGPWVPYTLGIGLGLIIVALTALLWHFAAHRPSFVALPGVVAPNSQGFVRANRQLFGRVGGVFARLTMRHNLRIVWIASLAVFALLLGGLAVLWLAERYSPDMYRQYYAYTHTWMIGLVAVGSAMAVGVALGIFAVGRSRLVPMRVASDIDNQLGLNGVAETVFGLNHLSQVSGRPADTLADNGYLLSKLPQASASIRPAKLVSLFPFIMSTMLALGITAVAAASYQLLPLPQFDPVELPDPEICPPPNNNRPDPPPPVSLAQPQPQSGDGEGATGLDVTNSQVPEDQIAELESQLGVGGTDDAGEPFDYHTTLPSREFESERRRDLINGLGIADDVPDGLAGSGRQNVPNRFLGL